MIKIPASQDINEHWKLKLFPDYIKKWATVTPDQRALVFADTGRVYSYKEFDELNTLYSMRLIELGIKKGDVVAIQFLSVPEFYFMMFACASVGAILATIDIRLQAHEAVRDLSKVSPVAFFGHGKTALRDFGEVASALQEGLPSLKHVFQFDRAGNTESFISGALDFNEYFSEEALNNIADNEELLAAARQTYVALDKRDPHIIIYTTGTTGDPKPGVICHEGTIINTQITVRGVGLFGTNWVHLNAMPTSHVTGTLQGGACFTAGGCFVTMSVFDPEKTLQFIDKYKPTRVAFIPTQFRMLWALPDFDKYDLSSARSVGYGGSAVDKPFLERMSKMAPTFGTGYGMTECGGYIAFTPKGATVDEVFGQVGQTFPDLAKVTIREPMNPDRTAGKELPVGELGEICVEGPLVFVGYYGDQAATDAIKTKEGILYTGDMGFYHDYGNYRGLRFEGRRKFVVKPKGYLVFPDEVAFFIATHPKVGMAHVAGAPHDLYTDGLIAIVQAKPGVELTAEEIMEYCKDIASYKRPLHVEIWSADQPFLLNRTNKIDIQAMNQIVLDIAAKLKTEGKWD